MRKGGSRRNKNIFRFIKRRQRRAPRCGACKSPIVLRKGPLRYFLGCSTFPKCRHTEFVPENRQAEAKSQYEKARDNKIAQARLAERIAAAAKKADISWKKYIKRRDAADAKIWAAIEAREKKKLAAAAKERRRLAAGRKRRAAKKRAKRDLEKSGSAKRSTGRANRAGQPRKGSARAIKEESTQEKILKPKKSKTGTRCYSCIRGVKGKSKRKAKAARAGR